ncbi:MAG: glutamate--tRNA ligase [Saprospiraceae bacterium]|nr:MAG: glutamate--tRNA ligase [Saprospiraceae bacterium]
MNNIRVRFAPSPTGALHIGGVRTALYNYLLAKKYNGTFILRIEDTDQTRYVDGAEDYIIEALRWCGLIPAEGPGFGGDYGPYRQSDRKEIYEHHASLLIDNGKAYYAFDTPEELNARRELEKEKGNHSFKYDAVTRKEMRNSLSLPADEVSQLLAQKAPYTIRLNVPSNELIRIQDMVRGEVVFQSNELDDKVLLKTDGMPTYHLANIVDDHLMKISHVIRGEEWLPSTAHHVLLYRAFGWEESMPAFAHLPLILKPNGKGKLSKRDGLKLGIPVFPLSWEGDTPEESFPGFREFGFDAGAVVNFMAFLGWNPGTEQEIFSLDELAEAFTVEKIGKAGARFDFDKAQWYNQQYIMATDDRKLAEQVRPWIEGQGYQPSDDYLTTFCHLMKERVTLFSDFWETGYYFFAPVKEYDTKTIRKRWKLEQKDHFIGLAADLQALKDYTPEAVKQCVEAFMEKHELKFGEVLPILRIATSGTTKGPSIFDIMALLGKAEVHQRLTQAFDLFDTFVKEQ